MITRSLKLKILLLSYILSGVLVSAILFLFSMILSQISVNITVSSEFGIYLHTVLTIPLCIGFILFFVYKALDFGVFFRILEYLICNLATIGIYYLYYKDVQSGFEDIIILYLMVAFIKANLIYLTNRIVYGIMSDRISSLN